ncbi:hypothetical protein IDSA_10555 [Pseudidiomarina salinarum]|uniref:FAD-binding domain-containing protein n=1 Tax=Pseudidiomarina salinarum TaxID=435908 RepID=A0A094ITN7_9GAMM|nr:2-octaprenyl-6-methoxyphenyl hydroxylase [Pseudidiomarina salinarum]KFZ30492.1 hypothetical protein IDSA_10555 [Pseudidiomarina salinarum]RUO68639.1 2-octaprenyl-6-methoxyphenyl hydroxylase [Pseudidiomarina salinarum]
MDAAKVTPVVIAGGGLVGALSALLIARHRPDWQVKVLEPQPAGPVQDGRTIALSAGTVGLLEREGIWPQLSKTAYPIEHIHVSDRGYGGVTRLHAEEHQVAALGQVIAAADLNRALYEACQAQPNIEWIAGARFSDVTLSRTATEIIYQQDDGEHRLPARLLVGADGQRSRVRDALHIETEQSDYQQEGIISTLTLSQPLAGWAYERFTDNGPVALLPLNDYQASLVWSLPPAEAEAVRNSSDAEFLRRCQQAFGYRAGRFTAVGERLQFPLRMQLAKTNVKHRALLIGNASHALHPIAGQGFNLGVRDAIVLSEILRHCDDPGSYSVLNDYWRHREADYKRVIGLTDLLVRGFSNSYVPLTFCRNLALLGLDILPPLQQQFARQTMGYVDQLKPVRE